MTNHTMTYIFSQRLEHGGQSLLSVLGSDVLRNVHQALSTRFAHTPDLVTCELHKQRELKIDRESPGSINSTSLRLGTYDEFRSLVDAQ